MLMHPTVRADYTGNRTRGGVAIRRAPEAAYRGWGESVRWSALF